MLHLRGLSRGGFSDCLAAETRRDEDCIYYQPPEELEEERRDDLRELYAGNAAGWLMPEQYEQGYIKKQQAAGRWPIASVY